MKSARQYVLQALALFALYASPTASEIVYWENQVITSDYTIAAGDTVVLRGTNYVAGQIEVSAGAVLSVDPNQDSLLHVGNIEVFGSFLIGTVDAPHTKKAEFELLCHSKKLPTDETRKSVVVREHGTLAFFGSKGTTTSSDPTKSNTWTKLQDTAEVGDCCLYMDLPEGWEVGDEIVLPSTDFDPHQTEIRTITAINPTCIEINEPLVYMHYGLVTEGVDERAEIGLLTRSIVFRGCQEEVDSGVVDVGAHMMFMEGFTKVQVQGIEVINFGQGDQMGRYPLHFHLCGRVPVDTFLKYNTIRDSNFRAITIHGSQGILVDGNVAYNISGHAVMLEDGAENDNVITRNLIVLVKEKTTRVHLGSDAQIALSAFYITNADNTYTHNAVAAVEGTGFWIHTRLQVKGLSYATGLYDDIHPFKVAIRQMQYNSVHSSEFGFKIESPDLDVFDYPQTTYSPPFTFMPDEMPVIGDFTVHHCRQGGWFRMYRIIVDRWIVGDVTEGVQMLTQGNTADMEVETYVRDSLFVGSTANRGTRVENKWQFINFIEDRTDSAIDRSEDSRMGIKLYDGPLYISNCTFANWYSQPCLNYYNPAIGTRLFNAFAMSTATSIDDATFIKTDYRVYVNDREADGGKSTVMVDRNGDVSGQVEATLLPTWDFYYAPYCTMSSEWGYACPQRYVNLDVVSVDSSQDPTRYGSMMIYRSNVVSASDAPPSLEFDGMYIPAANGWLYHPIISPGASYVMHFKTHTPAILKLVLSNAMAGDTFTLTVIYPPSTTGLSSVINTVTGLSLTGMVGGYDDETCVNCYYFDSTKQLLTLRLRELTDRTGPDNSCPPTGCLAIEIRAQGIADDANSGIADIVTTQAYPLLLHAESDHGWLHKSFILESAAVNTADNMNWCNLGDPCLDSMDQGNRRMGILAYYDDPCDGIGCFSSTCRYCKLAFSSPDSPFLPCPYDPNLQYAPPSKTVTVCSSFVSNGDIANGVEVLEDKSCATGGLGCINDNCRFCKAWESPQSSAFLDCATITTPAPSITQPTTEVPTVATPSPTTVAPVSPATVPTPARVSEPTTTTPTLAPAASEPIDTSTTSQPTEATLPPEAATPVISGHINTPNPVTEAPQPTDAPAGPTDTPSSVSATPQPTDAPAGPIDTPSPVSEAPVGTTDIPVLDAPQPTDAPSTDAPNTVTEAPQPMEAPPDGPTDSLSSVSAAPQPTDPPVGHTDTPSPSSNTPPSQDAPAGITVSPIPATEAPQLPVVPPESPSSVAEPPTSINPNQSTEEPIDTVTDAPASNSENTPQPTEPDANQPRPMSDSPSTPEPADTTSTAEPTSSPSIDAPGTVEPSPTTNDDIPVYNPPMPPASSTTKEPAGGDDEHTNADAACLALVPSGDIEVGVGALSDDLCADGGLGCFSLSCRYCQSWNSTESSHLFPCSRTAIRAAYDGDDATFGAYNRSDSCWHYASPADIEMGRTALSDPNCKYGGLGCLSRNCRFCQARVVDESSPYMPCDVVVSSTNHLIDDDFSSIPNDDPCRGLVSSGDISVGISALTDSLCTKGGGVGCVNEVCRFCKVRNTQQSNHLINCLEVLASNKNTDLGIGRMLVAAAPASVVPPIDRCSFEITVQENQAGIFGYTDYNCDKGGVGCFSRTCRYCRTADAANIFKETDEDLDFDELEVCATYVISSSVNRHGAIGSTQINCAALVSFGDAQEGISAAPDNACTTNPSLGCFARQPCRYCKYRETPRSTSFRQCSAESLTAAPTVDTNSCKGLSVALGLADLKIVRDPLCSAGAAHHPVGCVAFTSCRMCKPDGDTGHSDLSPCTDLDFGSASIAHSTSPQAITANFQGEDVSADDWAHLDFTRVDGDEGVWLPFAGCFFGCACLFALAMVVKHYRTRQHTCQDPLRKALNPDQQSIMRLSFDSRSDLVSRANII